MARLLCLFLCASLLSGCATSPSHPKPDAATALLGSTLARAVPIFHGTSGNSAPWSDMLSAAANADVLVIGENHGHPLGLANAAAIWADLAGPNRALSMEFLERDVQVHVDDYLSSLTDERTFQTRAFGSAVSNPPGHLAMINGAKATGSPIIASNAPRRYVRIARLEGYTRLAALGAEQRRLFRIPDRLPEPGTRYRRDFDTFLRGSSDLPPDAPPATPPEPPSPNDEGMFRSQSLWDWTMAESLTNALEQGHRPVLQVVGRFHSDFDGGLVMALSALRPGVRVLTVSYVNTLADGPPDAPRMHESDRDRADFVVYVGPQ